MHFAYFTHFSQCFVFQKRPIPLPKTLLLAVSLSTTSNSPIFIWNIWKFQETVLYCCCPHSLPSGTKAGTSLSPDPSIVLATQESPLSIFCDSSVCITSVHRGMSTGTRYLVHSIVRTIIMQIESIAPLLSRTYKN